MENQQSMSCESLLADLERVVVLRKNAKAPRIDTLDKIMKATVQKLQDAFHLETQAGLSESRILEYLDCTTRARQVIASYQRAPFSSALWKEQQCNGIHTCVDMFFARLLNSLDGTIAPETVKDVDNIMALERLADIEKKHNGWMGPPTSIGVIIEQKMALALEKASLVLPAEKDDNKEQTKDSVLHFVSIDRTHLTLEEHHNIMDNLERELTELNSRLDQTEAEKDSLEKKVVGLGAEIARLNKSSELAQALLKASEGITGVSDHATQASDDMEDVRPPSFSIPPVSPILVVANPTPDSTSSVVGVTPSTTRYAESASDPYFFLYSDEEDDDNDEEKEVSNHGEGEEKEEIVDKGKGKEKKSSMGSGMAPQTKQMSADQGLTTNETKDKLDHATYAQVSPNPGAEAYYASPAFTQYPGPHATSGAYHPANAPHTTPYGAPQPQVFRRIVRGISPYAPAYPSASTYPRSDYPVYQPSQNARHPPASLASGRKSGFRYGRGYGAAYGCLPMKRA